MYRANTAPRDKISMTLPSERIKLLLLGGLSSHFRPPQNQRFAVEAWTRRDSNPHLRPSRGAVFPLHHGPEETIQPGYNENYASIRLFLNASPERESHAAC